MNLFLDSSFLLSLIFEEKGFEEYYDIWKKGRNRLGSILISIESINSIRRASLNLKNKSSHTELAKKEKYCESLLLEVSQRNIDQSIYEIIKSKKELSGCRSLDAIHLATALDFKRNSHSEIFVCATDIRLREVAKKIGFQILPAVVVS